MRSGSRHSPESIEKMRQAAAGMSLKTRKKMRQAKLGTLIPPETREKMRLAALGRKFSPEAVEKRSGPRSWNWKGDDVSYSGLHRWVRRNFGLPRLCQVCGTTEAKRYDWASRRRIYSRDRSEWLRLCRRCHNRRDHPKRRSSMWATSRSGKKAQCDED